MNTYFKYKWSSTLFKSMGMLALVLSLGFAVYTCGGGGYSGGGGGTPPSGPGAVLRHTIAIDTANDVGQYTSLTVDGSGQQHAVYYDVTNGYLKYATCASNCTIASNWTIAAVDTTGDVGRYTSLAAGGSILHVSYYDFTNGDLKYATCSSGCATASNWTTVAVDTTGNVGWYSSLAVGGSILHVSYYDFTNGDLKYATCSSGCTTASNWTIAAVDTTGDVGWYSSLAVDGSGGLHVTYYYVTNGDLKYATCSSGCTTASNWTTVAVDTTGNVGWYSSLAVDGSGRLHVSYEDYNFGHPNLKYATCATGCTTASNWTTVTVDGELTAGAVGLYTSLAVDGTGGLHVSYYDSGNGDLKYATCAASCTTRSYWQAMAVDTTGDVGQYTSLTLDGAGRPHVSYYDVTNGDLKYAE